MNQTVYDLHAKAFWKNYKKTEICVTRVANMDSQTNMITNGIKA